MAPPKAKGQKMGLGEFLTDTSLGSWADEMEDAPIPCGRTGSGYGGDRSYNSSAGGSGSYADRGYSIREALPLPSKPPYTVHLGNMSFDATEGDIQDFFAACEITSVRIVEDKLDRKPKGFGYAEFASLDGLKKALEFNGTQFQGRNIRVSVAEPQKDRPDAREFGDWTRKGPLPDLGQRRPSDRSAYGSAQNFEEIAGDRTSRRQPFEQGDGKVRDFGNWERKGPLNPSPSQPTTGSRHLDRPSSNDGPRERRNSPAWGEGRSQDGSRPPRRDFAERPIPERAPTAAELDNQWRSKMRPDAPLAPVTTSPTNSNKEASAPSSPSTSQTASLTTRPKLNLQKRTVSHVESTPAAPAPPSDSKSSPFGAARPIDTAARDKEIEDKLKLKKLQEEKTREEKRQSDEKAKEERRLVKEVEKAEKSKEKTNGQTKGSEQAENQGRNYQILRRDMGNDEIHLAGSGDNLGGTNGLANENTPEDILQADVTKSNGADIVAEAGVDPEDNEGWSKVSKPQKNRKGTNPTPRFNAL